MNRKRLMYIGVLVVVLIASTYLIVTRTYRVEHGDAWYSGKGATYETNERDVAIHEMRAGHTVEIAITVRNTGPFPVVFDGVAQGGPDILANAVKVLKHVANGPRLMDPAIAEPFRRTTIRNNEQIEVWIALRQTGVNRYEPCSEVKLDQFTVQFSVLGTQRTHELALYTAISFRVPC